MTSLFRFYRNLNLGLKLNVMVVLSFGVLLIIVIVITNRSVGNLTLQTGRQRAQQEVGVVQSRFAEAEQEVLAAAKLLAAQSGLIEAVANRDTAAVRVIALSAVTSIDLDNIHIVDADGLYLMTTAKNAPSNPGTRETLLSLGLLGIEATSLVSDEEGTFLLDAVIPLRDDPSGAIVGGLLVGREIDDKFLAKINFARDDVHLALIRNGQVVIQHVTQSAERDIIGEHGVSPTETSIQFANVALDETAIKRALSGQTVIVDDFVYSMDNVPYTMAYTPLRVDKDGQTVLSILVKVDKLFLFQRQLTTNMSTTFILLMLVGVISISLFAYKNITVPVGKLIAVAKQMTDGDYSQSAEVTTTDEVGQLARAFNEMANAIQKRKTALQNLTASLEQRVVMRTADLEAANAQLQQEIVERKQAEEALRESREHFRQVVSSITHHVYMTEYTPAGKQINRYISPNVEDLTGYPLEKFTEDWSFWPTTVIHPADRAAAAHQAARFARGQNSEMEYRLVRADGKIIWVHDSGRVEKGIAWPSLLVYGVVSDITERKRVEEALTRAHAQALEVSRLKSQLLANVSHDLRTPLNAILGHAEMLQKGIYGSLLDKQHHIIQRVILNTESLTEMVNKLMDQAQLEAGTLKLKITPFAPVELIERMQSTMKVLAETKGVQLTSNITADVPSTLSGDLDRLYQILMNLVGNAIKFTERGSVQVRIYRTAETHWAIQVSDTGPGIPPEAHASIFEPFWQVDGTATREYSGTGLGLSIVKQLTTMMGGQVMLESEVGQGSTFTVLLPLKQTSETVS